MLKRICSRTLPVPELNICSSVALPQMQLLERQTKAVQKETKAGVCFQVPTN